MANGNPLQYSGLENPLDRGDWLGLKESDMTEGIHFHFHKSGKVRIRAWFGHALRYRKAPCLFSENLPFPSLRTLNRGVGGHWHGSLQDSFKAFFQLAKNSVSMKEVPPSGYNIVSRRHVLKVETQPLEGGLLWTEGIEILVKLRPDAPQMVRIHRGRAEDTAQWRFYLKIYQAL